MIQILILTNLLAASPIEDHIGSLLEPEYDPPVILTTIAADLNEDGLIDYAALFYFGEEDVRNLIAQAVR